MKPSRPSVRLSFLPHGRQASKTEAEGGAWSRKMAQPALAREETEAVILVLFFLFFLGGERGGTVRGTYWFFLIIK